MRLASPLYESLPVLYAGIGGLAFCVAYVDPEGPSTIWALLIGFAAEIAALTVVLRRQDCRARNREYAGARIELPPI